MPSPTTTSTRFRTLMAAALGVMLVASVLAVLAASRSSSGTGVATLAGARKASVTCTTPTPTVAPTATATTTPTGVPIVTGTPSPSSTPTPTCTVVPNLPPLGGDDVRIVQANLLSGQAEANFISDAGTVLATSPDFITYNEVPYRPDTYLAPPPGYALWRTLDDQYTRAVPVAWRTDRWSPVASGTAVVTDKRGKIRRGDSVELGVRRANWVTLQDAAGRKISVVATHLPPYIEKSKTTSGTEGLLEQGIDSIGALVQQLGVHGPVLVGGDFNVPYSAARYPRAQLSSYDLVPTYDLTGSVPVGGTGDHFGATIDYVFLHSGSQFRVTRQETRELYSDHDALVVDLHVESFAPSSSGLGFTAGKVHNDPRGEKNARRAVLNLVVRAIDAAPKKAVVRIATEKLRDPQVSQALARAVKRKVKVQFMTGNPRTTGNERMLMKKLGTRARGRDWAVLARNWHLRQVRNRMPATTVLVSQAGSTNDLRIDVNQALTRKSAKSPTEATVMVDQSRYGTAFKKIARLARKAG